MEKSVDIVCKGRVQGVYYRASTKDKAQELGVKGWVKNEPNGDVRIRVTGEDKLILRLVDWCKTGPRMATVEAVHVTELADSEVYPDFNIRY